MYCGWVSPPWAVFRDLYVRTLREQIDEHTQDLLDEYIFARVDADGTGFLRQSLIGSIPP